MSEELPKGWRCITNDDGLTYYHNDITSVTQWEHPNETTPGQEIDNNDKEDEPVQDLPSDWEETENEEGVKFYHNKKRNISQWKRPSILQVENMKNENKEKTKDDGDDKVLPPNWRRLTTDGGAVYYHNDKTKKTQWDRPRAKTAGLSLKFKKKKKETPKSSDCDETNNETEMMPVSTVSPHSEYQSDEAGDQPTEDNDGEDCDETVKSSSSGFCAKLSGALCCKVCVDSINLQIKKTPFKSTMIQLEGYEINKENRKWIGSVCLAFLLVVTAAVGSVFSVSSFNTDAICEGSSEQVIELLEEYRIMTGFYRNVGVGNASKAKVDELYYKAWERYNYHKTWDNTTKNGSLEAAVLFNTTYYKLFPQKYAEPCRQSPSNCTDPQAEFTLGKYDCSGANLTTLTGNCSWTGWQRISNGDAFPDLHPTPAGELEERANQQCIVPDVEVEVCWDNWGLKVICKKVKKDVPYPCGQNVDTKNLYVEGDTNVDTNRTFQDFDDLQYEQVSEAASQILWVIYRQANYISSFYCCWLALLIFIGGPYVLTSTRLKTKVQRNFSRVTKIYFVLIVLMIYYGAQILDAVWAKFFIETNLWAIMKMALANPCFADTTFLLELTAGAKEICTALGESEVLYNAVKNNLVLYESAEQTYRFYYWQFENDTNPAGDDIKHTYKDETEFIFYDPPNLLNRTEGIYWDYNTTRCDTNLFLEEVGPSEAEADLSSVALFISAIAALMIQPIVANLIWSIFVLIDPMAPYWGRIEMPLLIDKEKPDDAFEEHNEPEKIEAGQDNDLGDLEAAILNELANDAHNERRQTTAEDQKLHLEAIREHVIKWERTKGFCPCVMWLVILVVVIVLQA